MSALASRARGLAAPAPAVAVVVVLFGGAVAGLIRTSVTPLGEGATLEPWRELLADPAFVDAVWFTLRVALVATAASCLLALVLAQALRRRGAALRALASLPVPVPHVLVALLAVVWLAPGGLAERALGALPLSLVRDEWGLGVVLVYVYKETPFLVLLLLAAMGRSLREREEAAAVHGAGGARRLAWVVWPAVRRPLTLGAVVVGAFVIGAFEVPLAVGPNRPPTLAVYALEATQGDLLAGESRAAAALLVASGASVALALAGAAILRRGWDG